MRFRYQFVGFRQTARTAIEKQAWVTFHSVSILTILLAGGYLYFANLGGSPLRVWDEATYATIAEDIYRHGRWIEPRSYLNVGGVANPHTVFFDKPPLVFWLQAISMHAFGKSAFAVRLPSAIAVILTGYVIYGLLSSVRNRRAGFFGALVYLLTPYLLFGMNGGREGATDAVFALLGTSYIALFWYAGRTDSRRTLIPMGVAVGLLLLTKSWAAGFYLFAIAPLVIRYRGLLRTREFAYSTLIAITVGGSWPVYMWLQHGRPFVERFLGKFLVGEASSSSFTWGYIERMAFEAATYKPWFFFFLAGVGAICYASYADRDLDDAGLVFVWWALSLLVVISYFSQKNWHIIPFFSPSAAVVGILFDRVTRSEKLPLVVFLGAAALAASTGLYWHTMPPIGTIGFATFLVAMAVLALWGRTIRDHLSEEDTRALTLACVPLLALLLVGALVGTSVAQPKAESPEEQLAHVVNQEVPSGELVYVQSDFTYPIHEFAFVSERPITGYYGEPPPDAAYVIRFERSDRKGGEVIETAELKSVPVEFVRIG